MSNPEQQSKTEHVRFSVSTKTVIRVLLVISAWFILY